MKTITDDPEGFFEQGGWNFLEAESDSEQKEVDDDISDEEDDAYAPKDSEDEDESEDSDDSEYADSDSESDSGSGFGSGSGSCSESESGKDWSELEEEARKADLEESDTSVKNDDRKRKKPATNTKSNGASNAKRSRK